VGWVGHLQSPIFFQTENNKVAQHEYGNRFRKAKTKATAIIQ
jgi:hypothetical protein